MKPRFSGNLRLGKNTLMMNNQGITSKDAVKVSIRHVLKTRAENINDAINMLIQVPKESRHIWEESTLNLLLGFGSNNT